MADPSVEAVIQLVAGSIGGTTGAIITCPLEVVKTRLQSSNSGFEGGGGGKHGEGTVSHFKTIVAAQRSLDESRSSQSSFRTGRPPVSIIGKETFPAYSGRFCHSGPTPNPRPNVFDCLRFILVHEGVPGLFKGLGPNLLGVAPSRAIYFWSYNTTKKKINSVVPEVNRDTSFVHVLSAIAAGFSSSSITNPIWLMKTRLQLDKSSQFTLSKCAQLIYNQSGILGFWKGVTASYWGISETIIHFVVYEHLKFKLATIQNKPKDAEKTFVDFVGFMLCGGCSRACATITTYPHEVARTRLREEGTKYRSFWPCLISVYKTEGRPGLYRGLMTQIVRQIPNTAIMMSTYEFTSYILTNHLKTPVEVKKDEQILCKSSHSQ